MEAINWAAAKVLFDVLQALFMVLVTIYVWWTNKHRATGTAIRAMNERLDGVDRHVSQLEQAIKHRPRHDDLDKLRAEMAQTNRGLAELGAQLQGTTALLNRLHDYLLQERGGR